MYRNLGYYVDSPAQVLLPAARRLVAKYGSRFDTVFSDAFREAGLSDRRFMKDLTRDDLIQLGKAQSFPVGSPELKDLLHLVYAIMHASGWGDYRPAVIRYTEDPHMSLNDMLTEALADHVAKGLADLGQMWPEKCNVECFRTHLASLIRRIATLWEHRPYIAEKLGRYIGDILYRMKTMDISPTALDQWDRTLLILTVKEQKKGASAYFDRFLKYDRDDSSAYSTALTITDARSSDPLIAPEIARLRSVCQPGPCLRYTRLLSNAEPRELIALMSPVLPDLPLATGYLIPVGPFHEMDLAVITRLSWGDAEQYAGYAENVVFPPLKDSTTPTQLGFRTPAIAVTDQKDYALRLIYDWPTLELVNDTDDTLKPNLKVSWFSPAMQRMVHDTDTSINSLILDLAVTHKELGETPVPMNNIQEIKFADLSHDELTGRRVTKKSLHAKTDDADDAPVLRARVFEDVWHFEGGKLLKKKENLDVTPLFTRLGNISFRPALARFFRPSRSWFLSTDQNAVDFICGRLGLNTYDATRSKLAISISHNVALYKRVTGVTDDPFDVEAVIKAMHGMSDAPGLAKLPTVPAALFGSTQVKTK